MAPSQPTPRLAGLVLGLVAALALSATAQAQAQGKQPPPVNLVAGLPAVVNSQCYTPRLLPKYLTDGKFQPKSGTRYQDLNYFHSCGKTAKDSIGIKMARDGKDRRVVGVKVWNRCDCCTDRAAGLRVYVETAGGGSVPCGGVSTMADATCNSAKGPEGQFWERTCSVEHAVGIRVVREASRGGGDTQSLNIPEIQVMGYAVAPSTTTTATIATTTTAVDDQSQGAEPRYLGCYVDDGQRDLRDGPKQYGYTPGTCATACAGYKYFALQDGGWCACGNAYATQAKYTRRPSAECNKGFPQGGGPWRNAVFINKAPPCRGAVEAQQDSLALLEATMARSAVSMEKTVALLKASDVDHAGLEAKLEALQAALALKGC